ncbi:predicted protein [Nematostella vectensis]|uniref:Uncharacterized protein n=1 Tax=Nematostella vectensis TaxID=45351 RepID=A7RLH6_NEMVE|nr:predicted protein [Nematostella vectensis]|eukprot:XP_001639754.1 predicted protein [Nematostella vectensis]
MEARVSGAVMASLFQELTKGQNDVEGLLLGDSTGRTINTISDSQAEKLRFERIATIQGFIPCSRVFSFYNEVGKIDSEKLKETLQNRAQEVIGWYKYRRNSQALVTMRERYVHHNLMQELGFQPAHEFLFALFTSCCPLGMATHLYNYQVLSANQMKSNFKSHKLKVVNLRDTSHSEYRLQPQSIRTKCERFNNIIDDYRDDLVRSDGCLTTHTMCMQLMIKMKDLVEEVKNSESTVLAMEHEVCKLREKVLRKREMIQSSAQNTSETRPAQPGSNKSSNTKAPQPGGSKGNLIDLDFEEDFERVVEGAEMPPKPSITKSPFRFGPKDGTKSMGVDISSAIHEQVKDFFTESQTRHKDHKSQLASNHEVRLNSQIQTLDEDETQDFSPSEDMHSNGTTSQTLAASPEF